MEVLNMWKCNLKQICEDRGIIISELPKLTGMSKPLLNKMLDNNIDSVSLRKIEKICNILDICFYDLIEYNT